MYYPKCLSDSFEDKVVSNFYFIIAMDDKYWISRRTIRRYTATPVSDTLIRDLLYQASFAPNTGNMQLYSVVITRDPDIKKSLAPAHFNQPQVEGCNVLLTFCADLNRFSYWCEQRDANPEFDNFQSLVAAFIDTSLLAQQFNTLAELNGLGCCILGTTTYNAEEIASVLRLPRLVIPVTTITVGYPADDPDLVGRLPIDAFVHDDVYREYSPDNIDTYYKEKEGREDSKRFVEENGKRTLAQVFTDVRYPGETSRLFSKRYLDFIRKSGIEI